MTAQLNGSEAGAPEESVVEKLGRARDGFLNVLESVGQRFRLQRIPLRQRIMLTFSLGAFALSAFLAAVTYSFTKSALINDRERSSIAQTFRNANQLADAVISDPSNAKLLDRVQGLGDTSAALNSGGKWTQRTGLDQGSIPTSLQQRVLFDRVPAQMVINTEAGPALVIGVPISGTDASYFESTNLTEIQDTLRNVGRSLVAAAVVTTGLGLLLGALAARRSVRPIADAAQAAKAIADGRLDTRLVVTEDPDLHLLATAFNDMASALQLRLERDARFASDVSHELRSPLMTLAASAEVLQARRDEIPERSQAALDLLVADVARFQGMVEDLLEISRFDAGAIRLNKEDLVFAEFVRNCVAASSLTQARVNVSDRAETLIIHGDKRRLFRVVANLLDNARFYGGGSDDVTVEVTEALGGGEPIAHGWIAVEDHGPGVPAEERTLIFERFARGSSAGRRATSEGAGLGLSLVDEHVRMHGGRVWVEDRLDGTPGARFVVELPAEEVGV